MTHYHARDLVKNAIMRNHSFPPCTFKLDTVLRLNITLQNIYFSQMNLLFNNKCRFQFIDIISNFSTHFKYCGILPEFQNFLDSNIVRIEVMSSAIIVIRVEIFYSVIDENAIASKIHSSFQIKDIKSFYGTLTVPKLGVIVSCFVRTDHHKIIVVEFFIRKKLFDVYDGPGSLSQLITSSSKQSNFKKFVSSTFQIFLLAQITDTFEFPNRAVQFLSQLHKKQINVINISSETNSTIHFPQACIGNKLLYFYSSSRTCIEAEYQFTQ